MLTRIYNHGQIIWDEHLKTFFKNIYHISFTKSTPSPRNDLDVATLELSWQKLRYKWQQHCDRGAGNTSVHTSE